MNVYWTETAKSSFQDELDFIYRKWGKKEVDRFINLSTDFINLLVSGVLEGKPSRKRNIRISVISKQTTLIYRLNKKKKQIELILFWNNLKNPNQLENIILKNK